MEHPFFEQADLYRLLIILYLSDEVVLNNENNKVWAKESEPKTFDTVLIPNHKYLTKQEVHCGWEQLHVYHKLVPLKACQEVSVNVDLAQHEESWKQINKKLASILRYILILT